jgi:GNAT superfamily N-acetyltransferase
MALTTLPDGRTVLIRPIGPDDAGRLTEAFSHLSPQSRYRRFFSACDSLSPTLLRYFTDVDHVDHEALVAIGGSDGAIVGVARFIRAPKARESAEVAVTVIDDWQSDHLGIALMAQLIPRARAAGVRRFTADVLWENGRMLHLLRDFGPIEVLGLQCGVETVALALGRSPAARVA